MENIFECLEKELIFAKAKVEVLTELIEKYKPVETQVTEEVPTDFTDETQSITSSF